MSDTIQVKATARGYFGGEIREVGDEFPVPKGTKGSWLEPVTGAKRPTKAAKPADKDEGADDPDAVDLV